MEQEQLPKTQSLKVKIVKLVLLLIAIISGVVFALEQLFSDFEPTDPRGNNVQLQDQGQEFDGTIKFVTPGTFPGENISYELVDAQNNPIILLKSTDDKLVVAENLFVTVRGTKTKTAQNEDVLIVTEIIVRN